MNCFFFKLFKWRCSRLLVIFLMSGSRWRRKYPILAQVLSTISLVTFECCLRLFVAMCFFLYIDGGWLILLEWVVSYWICLICWYLCWMLVYLYFNIIASRICKLFLLLFLYMIFGLFISIFLISEDLSLSMSLLCFVIRYCFMTLMTKEK